MGTYSRLNKWIGQGLILVFFFGFLFSSTIVSAQDVTEDYQSKRIGEQKEIHSSIAISPANSSIVAISGNKSAPVYIYNWQDEEILHSYNSENWYGGSSLEYSPGGKYLVLSQLFYVDWAANRDKKVKYIVMDANSGEKIFTLEECNDLRISHDEKQGIALANDRVSVYDLASGKIEKSLNLPAKGFSFAISPNGEYLAVSHEPTEDELKKLSPFNKDKKALKSALKLKHQITIYTYPGFEKIKTINQVYDYIYELKFGKDGQQLFCLQIPHAKAQTGASGKKQTFVNIVDVKNWEPIRKAFMSTAIYQPDFKLSPDRNFFGIVSQGARFAELHIYDYNTRKMLDRFEFSYRLIESDEDGLIISDSRPSFVFLPNGETILMSIGNRVIKWNFNKE